MIKDKAIEWMKKGDADLDTVKALLHVDNFHPEIVCFHCQQAVEKYFKAYLTSINENVPRIHDLDVLLQKSIKFNSDFQSLDRFNISKLTDYAVDFRYPDEYIETTLEEAEKYFKLANHIREYIFDKINL